MAEIDNGATPPGGEGAAAGTQAGGEGSAAAAIAGAKPGGEGAAEKDVDLASTSDEDYAKLVQPDVEGKAADRSLITPMAKELREAGIQPSVMAKVAAIYRKVVDADLKRDADERAARMREMTEKCLAEITEEERLDFSAAYAEHIAKDPALKHVVDHTELGSSPAFIRLIALAGATLRAERQPPAAAAAGSSQTNLERSVFERTVPESLR